MEENLEKYFEGLIVPMIGFILVLFKIFVRHSAKLGEVALE